MAGGNFREPHGRRRSQKCTGVDRGIWTLAQGGFVMRSLVRVLSGLPAILLLIGLAGGASGRAVAAESSKAWLGVMMQNLDEDLRDGMDYRGEGVLISGVVQSSPAERAGIRKGDVLVSVNGRSAESSDALTDMIGGMRVGQSVSVVVMRDGTRRTLTARLGSRPDRADLEVFDRQWDDQEDMKGHEGLKGFKDLKDLEGFDFEDLPQDHRGEVYLRGLSMGRGRLGVRVENLSTDLAPYFDSPSGSGALVMEVMKDTPAEKAGLKAGDVITQIGDDRISDADDLSNAVRSAPEGKVTVTVTRKGARRSFEAELGEAPRSWTSRDGREFSMGPRRSAIRRRSDAEPPTPQGNRRDEVRELREQIRQLQEKLDKLDDNN